MRLSGHRVAELSRASNARGFADLTLVVGAIVGVVSIAHASSHWLVYLLAVIALGGLQNRLLVLAHEAWHRKAFAPVRLNQLVGAWCYSYPVGVPFLADQRRHLAHHRLVGRPADPDRPDYERPAFKTPGGVALFLLSELLGGKVALRVLSILKRSGSHAKANAEPRELMGIAAAQASLILVFTLFGYWWEYLVLWLLPLVSVASFLVSFRALIEHVHPSADADPHERLFDFAAAGVERLLVSPFLFHIHALHHAYPSVPHYRLKALQSKLGEGGYTYPVVKRPGYLQSYRLYLAELREAAGTRSGSPL